MCTSCIDQTYQKKEIIVIDNGGPDKTGEILDAIKDKNKAVNLRIVHLKESLGKKKAIEAAVRSHRERFTLSWIAIATWLLMQRKRRYRYFTQINR